MIAALVLAVLGYPDQALARNVEALAYARELAHPSTTAVALAPMGCVLYQLLTGRRPFDGEGEFAIIHQIVSQDPPPPSSINPQLPPALDAVVARALAKQRDDRYASAHEFAVALQEASGQVPDPTIVPPFSSSEFRGTRRQLTSWPPTTIGKGIGNGRDSQSNQPNE